MAPGFASQQPQGFQNHVEKIAIVGGGGHVGSFMVRELLKTGKHQITALSRENSTNIFAEGVIVVRISYSDRSSIVKALQGQEVLIITLSIMAQAQQDILLECAAEANVPWVLPNEWGVEVTNLQLGKDIFNESKFPTRAQIEELGKSSWIGVVCGFWYEHSLGTHPDMFGFNFHDQSVTFYDKGTARTNISTWPQVGRAVASLLNLKVLPQDEDDKSPTLTNFKNSFAWVSSFYINQKEMFDSVLRVTGTTEKEWNIKYESSEERYKDGLAQVQQGNRAAFVKLLYSRIFYPDGTGDFQSRHGLSNDILGLKEEDLDEYTREAIEHSPERKAYLGTLKDRNLR